jgi:Mg2+ and Co2+ transporter CorA
MLGAEYGVDVIFCRGLSHDIITPFQGIFMVKLCGVGYVHR